jgi:hypothetical protein
MAQAFNSVSVAPKQRTIPVGTLLYLADSLLPLGNQMHSFATYTW